MGGRPGWIVLRWYWGVLVWFWGARPGWTVLGCYWGGTGMLLGWSSRVVCSEVILGRYWGVILGGDPGEVLG